MIIATVALAFALYSKTQYKWIDSVSIYFAVFFVVLISSTCEYVKDKQFLKLHTEIMSEKCTVLRGQYGTSL